MHRAREVITSLHTTTAPQQVTYAPSVLPQKNDDHLVQGLQQEVARYKQRLAKLESVDMNDMTPRQAFDLLCSLKERI